MIEKVSSISNQRKEVLITMKDEQKNKPMPVTMTPNQKDWVRDEARRTGETMTAVIRRLIQNQMEKANG